VCSSDLAGIPIRLKAEALSDPTISVETEALTTLASQWETLTFDFSTQAPGTAAINFASDYRKVSIFFNFNTEGTNLTYYWDDVAFGASTTPSSVYDIIAGSVNHTILEELLQAAELNGTLSEEGTFTVFAPTDAAFGSLPEGVLDELVSDPTGVLTQILLYHVLGSTVLSGDLADGQTAATLHGSSVNVSIENGNVRINNALVTTADLVAENGVVHVIDAILLPPGIVLNTTLLDASSNGINIYPNPSNEFIQVSFTHELGQNTHIQLYDMTGKIVNEMDAQQQINQINTSNLSNGTYFVRINSENKSYFQKVIIVH
jgi:uncharacterized surface protein with fasciclin (FAS1) repeats